VKTFDVPTQLDSLRVLEEQVRADLTNKEVYTAARQITFGCPNKNDTCELMAIYNTVKTGNSKIKGLEKGLRYVSDSTSRDFFVRPSRMLKQCAEQNACAEDCDSHAALVCALAGSVGFRVGLRIYAPNESSPYTHVYAVALTPKNASTNEFGQLTGTDKVVGLDTTVKEARVGWQPPKGRVITAWILPERIIFK